MMCWRTCSGNKSGMSPRASTGRIADGTFMNRGASGRMPASTPFSSQHELQQMDTPRFKKGETLRLVQYIAPLPRGTQVTVLDINEKKRGTVYLVEATHRGERVKVWTKEGDVGRAFI